MRRNRSLIDIIEDHERDIKRLRQALTRPAGGGGGGVTDHGALTGLADDDHGHYWNDFRGDAKISTHTAIASAHHVKYTDGEVDAIVLTHKNLASAHHSKYTDGEVDAIVLTHKNLASAHHAKYTDSEAAAKIASDDLYVKVAGDTMTGNLLMGGFQIYLGGGALRDVSDVYMEDGDDWVLRGDTGTVRAIFRNNDSALAGDISWRDNAGSVDIWGWDESATSLYAARPIDMNANKITDLGTPSASGDAATKGYVDGLDHHTKYTDGEAVSAVGTPWVGLIAAEDHHTKYTSSEADARIALATISDLANTTITAIASGELLKWSGTAWINNTLSEAGIAAVGDLHTKYTDGNALTAMGVLTNSNTYNHNRYLDSEAVTAVGTPWVALIAAEDHHTKYTDSEAAAKIAADDLYLKTIGDLMNGAINMDNHFILNPLDPTDAAHVGDRGYNDARYSVGAHYTDSDAAAKIASDDLYVQTGGDVMSGALTVTSGGLTLAAATSGVIHRWNADGDSGSSRRFEWRRSASFGALELYGVDGSSVSYHLISFVADSPGSTTFEAPIFVPAPTVDLHAASKKYVDDIATGGGLPTTGGTMTGDIIMLYPQPEIDMSTTVDATSEKSGIMYGRNGGWRIWAGTSQSEYYYGVWTSGKTGDPVWGVGAAWMRGNVGSAAEPSISFIDDSDTGMYRVDSNRIGFSTGGIVRFHISGSGNFYGSLITGVGMLRGALGTVSAPAHSFYGDPDTGMYRYGTNEIGLAVGGVARFRLDSGGSINFGTMGATGHGLLRNSQGSPASPTYGFINDTDTGMYRVTTNEMAFSAGNKMVLRLSNGFLSSQVMYSNTTGSAANVHVATSGQGYLYRFTSARKYKSRITFNVDYLADYDLKPAKFYRKDDKRWFYGFIADDLGEQDKLLGVYEDDEIENYDSAAVMAVMAAKINRLERRLDALSATI